MTKKALGTDVSPKPSQGRAKSDVKPNGRDKKNSQYEKTRGPGTERKEKDAT